MNIQTREQENLFVIDPDGPIWNVTVPTLFLFSPDVGEEVRGYLETCGLGQVVGRKGTEVWQ